MKSKVLKYPYIPVTTHEFDALLQFGATYELMEFLETQQIKLSQRMAEEHDEQQIIERALTRMVESEDEGPLTKVGRKCNVGVGRVRIKLPPLSVALVEEHKELAKVSIGAKDMAIKNKNVWKTVNLTHDKLSKA